MKRFVLGLRVELGVASWSGDNDDDDGVVQVSVCYWSLLRSMTFRFYSIVHKDKHVYRRGEKQWKDGH